MDVFKSKKKPEAEKGKRLRTVVYSWARQLDRSAVSNPRFPLGGYYVDPPGYFIWPLFSLPPLVICSFV